MEVYKFLMKESIDDYNTINIVRGLVFI